jgi:hypothetical protein
LPKFIGAGSDGGFSGLMFDASVLMGLLCVFEGLLGVLKRLPSMFVASQVVFFSMLYGSGTVGVTRTITDFGGFLAGIFHLQLLGRPGTRKVSSARSRILEGRKTK